jgi:hypothetical protein
MHRVDPFIAVGDAESIRIAWNLIPGFTCLILGRIQWWLIESPYILIRRRMLLRSAPKANIPLNV